MKFIEGNYYTLIEENSVHKEGHTFKCDYITEAGDAEYGEEKYRATKSMCRNATTEEIIKLAESFTHPSELVEKGKIFDEVLGALKDLVELKQHKETIGKDERYYSDQPIYWKNAQELIEKAEKL